MVYCRKFLTAFFVISLTCFYLAGNVSDADSASAFELKSKYFNVTIDSGIDVYEVLQKLNVKYFLHLSTIPSESEPGVPGMLKDALDAIYLEVSDVLDIHMYSLRINLRIVPSVADISRNLEKHMDIKTDLPSYYYLDKNIIFISFEELRAGMLAHEVAHAIISHYFVVPPPPRVQEILTGYVEFSINKAVSK